ncbi:hypothetical protein ACFS07_36445 [Undibacterium arcticum]
MTVDQLEAISMATEERSQIIEDLDIRNDHVYSASGAPFVGPLTKKADPFAENGRPDYCSDQRKIKQRFRLNAFGDLTFPTSENDGAVTTKCNNWIEFRQFADVVLSDLEKQGRRIVLRLYPRGLVVIAQQANRY